MWEQRLNINVSRAVFYQEYMLPRAYYPAPKLQGEKVRQQMAHLSVKSARRLRLAINTLVETAHFKSVYQKATGKSFRFKVNFITLTLPSPQVHTDREIIQKCLSPFLEAWAKRASGLLYVWKAEVQDNGNIHFHITTNTFIHHEKLRQRWNRYMAKIGYLPKSKIMLTNSTDVHSVKSVKNIAAYLVAYVSKKDLYTRPLKRYFRRYKKQLSNANSTVCPLPRNYFNRLKRRLNCPLWGASKCLLAPTMLVDLDDKRYSKEIGQLLAAEQCHINTDYATIIPFEAGLLEALPAIWDSYKSFLRPVYERQKLIPKKFILTA